MFLSYLIVLLALLVATHVDLRKREVPDWVSYSSIVAGIIIALLTTIVTANLWPLINSLLGLGLGFLIGVVMYYAGQWGGGDAKLLMGIGALLGLSFTDRLFLNFILYLVIAGALYGLFFSIVLAIRHRAAFKKYFLKHAYTKQAKMMRRIFQVVVLAALVLAFLVITDQFFRLALVVVAGGCYLLFYAWLFARVLEEACMKKRIPVSKLVEGDWVLEQVKIGQKKIVSAKSGITLEQIAQLKKAKVKDVLVKEGIPFVPSFLIAYLLLLWLFLWRGIDLFVLF